jgi:molecular chaperone GrpE (heat shock protein)
MQTKNPTRKAELQAQLKEVELQLKSLTQQFAGIKKRAGESVSSSRKRADARKISELRKQLGIEK